MRCASTLTCIVFFLMLSGCVPGGHYDVVVGGDSDTVRFTKEVEVFGLHIYATNTTADEKLLHAANVLAEYIDNDEDGVADNPKIMKALLEGKGAIVM